MEYSEDTRRLRDALEAMKKERLQYVKEQIRLRIEDLKDSIEDDEVTKAMMLNKLTVIIDWSKRLSIKDEDAYGVICDDLYAAILGWRADALLRHLDELAAIIGKVKEVEPGERDMKPQVFDDMANADEMEEYLWDLAWERMRQTPDRTFDKETQEKYHVLGWRNGCFVNIHDEDEDDNMLGFTFLEVLELSKL